MDVTMKDIALHCGVSISTVSRILNQDGKRKVKGETANLVLRAANEMGFFDKKLFATSQRKLDTYNIGCVFTSGYESFVSPFFSTLMDGIQKEITAFSNICKINFYTFNITEFDFRTALLNSKLDGAVVLGRTSLETISFLKESVPNLVYAGLNRMGGMDEVVCDAYAGERAAVKYLVELGHSKIAFIGPVDQGKSEYNEYRYHGYADELAAQGLTAHKHWICNAVLTSAGGHAAATKLLQEQPYPTAIVVGNDTTALGVLRAVTKQGLRVPHDISIVGFDDIESSAFVSPSITTIHVPKSELGRHAVQILLDRLGHPRSYNLEMSIPFRLEKRESTCEVSHER